MLNFWSLILTVFSFNSSLQNTYEDVVFAKIQSASKNKDLTALVEKKLYRSDCINEDSVYSVYIVYNFDLTKKPSVEDLKSGKFIFSLTPKRKKSNDRISYQAFIRKENKIVADYIGGQIYCYKNKSVYTKYSELIDQFDDLGVTIAFQIPSANGSIYFGLNGDSIEVFELSDSGIIRYKIEDFSNLLTEKLYLK